MAAMNSSYEALERRALELEEARQVLRETDVFFSEAGNRREEIRGSFDESADRPLLDDVEVGGPAESGFGGMDLE